MKEGYAIIDIREAVEFDLIRFLKRYFGASSRNSIFIIDKDGVTRHNRK